MNSHSIEWLIHKLREETENENNELDKSNDNKAKHI